MKKFLKLIVVALLTFLYSVPAFAQQDGINVYLNNNQMTFATQPQIINNTTMVPLRTIFESMNYTIYWDDDTKTVTGISNENIVQLTINNSTAYKNGETIFLETPPQINNGTTLVPLRFIAESANATVDWDGTTSSVYIFTSESYTEDIKPVENKSITVEDLKKTTVLINTNQWQGSGVVLSSDGYIATNFHVVENASLIRVEFYDGTVYNGKVHIAGYDTARDLVILKIDKDNLDYAIAGNSDNVKVGDNVTAIGSPNGVLNVVSTGTVTDKDDFIISSDAYITGGSSGGGLFNTNGEVIGINSSYDTAGHYMAIPINHVSNMDISQNMSLNSWSNITASLVAPKTFTYTVDENSATISWDPVYSVDGYHIYSANSEDGKYTILRNPADNSNTWSWGFPYCFKITATENHTFYFKISSVRNGVESPLSEAYKVDM
ncbi:MAG: stalk domain-containing protein [Lachnospiraceae bacterium]|nr:stalk domain-containing protein [Lachnospiraceae bacterium]